MTLMKFYIVSCFTATICDIWEHGETCDNRIRLVENKDKDINLGRQRKLKLHLKGRSINRAMMSRKLDVVIFTLFTIKQDCVEGDDSRSG